MAVDRMRDPRWRILRPLEGLRYLSNEVAQATSGTGYPVVVADGDWKLVAVGAVDGTRIPEVGVLTPAGLLFRVGNLGYRPDKELPGARDVLVTLPDGSVTSGRGAIALVRRAMALAAIAEEQQGSE